MENTKSCDILVLGGGPAGYSAAIRAAELGASVILVEKDTVGGTCLNCGCIPTKFLWEALYLKDKLRKFTNYGIEIEYKNFHFASVQKQKAKTVELLVKGIVKLLENHSIETLQGKAEFLGKNSIKVALQNGKQINVSAKKTIIATGSRPKILKGLEFDHNKIIDSSDALNLRDIPKSILIIGGGAIGVEMATIFSGLGSNVTVIEKENQLLPGEDKELSEEVKKILQRNGVNVLVGTGFHENMLNESEKILIVTGRQPNVELGLEKAGINYSEKGISVNEYLQASNDQVYCAGDATGISYLAYVSEAQGIAAAENAMGKQNILDLSSIPRVVFSMPPFASAGIKESDLSADRISTGKFNLSANSRAFIEGERTGFVKIISDKISGKILGGHIIGARADELIAILSLAIRKGLSVKDFSRELFFHPSISEAIYEACRDTLKKS